MAVITYQCPQCGAPLTFHEETQHWDCQFCGGSFDLDTLENSKQDTEEAKGDSDEFVSEEDVSMREYTCPQCGAQIVTDETTAATFCIFCQNAAILSDKLRGSFKPEKVLPFQKSKEDAQEAFRKLCSKKPLLPKDFYSPDRIEKITGLYVPFWLFDCETESTLSASATRVHTWSDSKYHYTKTDYYHIEREGNLDFAAVPADGSAKMDNALMDSIEPYDLSQMVDYTPAYLAGFLAERYNEDQKAVFPRVEGRIQESVEQALRNTIDGYAGVIVQQKNVQIHNLQSHNVLLPVWMLMSRYKGKDYLFAMNGQTGKIVGDLPISIGRAVAYFSGVFAAAFILLFLGGLLF
ncbi:MAG: hypothetical protein ACOX6P_02815 [Candidatus Merdivicinus sp.]|jgi:DNA-directed RNA polymerase subunit RPC12/RpoP